MGKIRIEKFKKVYDTLLKHEFGEDENERLHYSYFDVLNDLEMLGHCEVDYVSRQVCICPPSFALLPNRGMPKMVLAGGRSEDIINHLHRLAGKNADKLKVTLTDHSSANNVIFPPVICVEAKSRHILKQVTERIRAEGNISVPASWSLLSMAPSIEGIMDSLEYHKEVEPNWKKRTFCNVQLRFRLFDCLDKIKLVNYTNSMSQQQKTWIWNGNQAATIERNWGRYAVLSHYKAKVLLFDEIKQRLAVPATVPLPKELAKVAVLCSGYLPRKKLLHRQMGKLGKEARVTVYEGISGEMALEISKKLGQTLLECHL